MIRSFAGEGVVGSLRGAMAFLVVISILSVAVALAYERHWEEFWQLMPWATLVLSGLALVALVLRTSQATIRIARMVAVLVLVAALLGIWRHFDHNYVTAVMDQDYADRWGEMPVVERVWTVANGSVGHVPVPAAGALVPVGVTLWMTTLGLGEQSRRNPEARRGKP
ncbi:MAG: hypothetical protein OXP73_00065 [Chloroflexota bacterium]|nr:hypothetical protein [Chloroflexota bacterium]